MPTRLLTARAALRTTPRRWLVALLVVGVAALSTWLSLTLTPPADIKLGVVSAQIKAAPGSGTVIRTAMGRPVTDDTINAGPLQVQVAVAVQPAPQVTEPQLLEALSEARPRVISAAVGYLLRVTLGAVLVALLLGFALLGSGRRGRRLLVVGATTFAVVGVAVGATAATTRLSTFDAASCAHGWSRYAIADLPDLTPPAPLVTPPTEATARANPGLIPIVLIADDHLNPEGLLFAHRLQTSTGARAVWDAGDTTSYGVPGEACVVAPLIRSFRVPYAWVRGNHDSSGFERVMRGIRGVHVLDGTTATTDGITVFGVGDPSFTPRRRTTSAVMSLNDARVRAAMPTMLTSLGSVPDVVLVHECQMAVSPDPSARGVAGIVPLVACGHTHRQALRTDDTTIVLHTGTVGAGGLDAFSVGGLQNFDAQLLLFDATTHRLVRYYDVNGEGGATATFTRHDILQPPAAPPIHGGI
ncbi:MAG TPA: metallophosphoesterase family protein [Mycobacteriales bacterium]|nr:metallophosphoesterase family protein [Mycobacteriales bacterium]